MLTARIYNVKDNKRWYVTKYYIKNKNSIKISMTKQRDKAMVFESIDTIYAFYMLLSSKKCGIDRNSLHLESEETSDKFEDKYGIDPLKDSKQRMIDLLMKKDNYTTIIKEDNEKLKTLKSINIEELSDKAKVETLEVIASIENEIKLTTDLLNALLKQKD